MQPPTASFTIAVLAPDRRTPPPSPPPSTPAGRRATAGAARRPTGVRQRALSWSRQTSSSLSIAILLAGAAINLAAVTPARTAPPAVRAAGYGVRVPPGVLAVIAAGLSPAPVDVQEGRIDYIEVRTGDDAHEIHGGRVQTYARIQAWAGPGGKHWVRGLREVDGRPVCEGAWHDDVDFPDDDPPWFDAPPDDPAALNGFLLTHPYPPLPGDSADLHLLYRISWLALEHIPTLRQRQTILRALALRPNLQVRVTGPDTVAVAAVGVEREPPDRYAPVRPQRRELVFDAVTGLLRTETVSRDPAVLAPGPHTPPPGGAPTVLQHLIFVDRRHLLARTGPTLGCPLPARPFDGQPAHRPRTTSPLLGRELQTPTASGRN